LSNLTRVLSGFPPASLILVRFLLLILLFVEGGTTLGFGSFLNSSKLIVPKT
jgi:hypothetical protein